MDTLPLLPLPVLSPWLQSQSWLTLTFCFSASPEPTPQSATLDTEKPGGAAATLADLPKATDLAPGSSEKSRASEAGGRKGLSVLQELQGPTAHSINGKTKPWEPFMAEEFAHQFHESVLQSTQKALQRHKGGLRLLSQCSGWSLDLQDV